MRCAEEEKAAAVGPLGETETAPHRIPAQDTPSAQKAKRVKLDALVPTEKEREHSAKRVRASTSSPLGSTVPPPAVMTIPRLYASRPQMEKYLQLKPPPDAPESTVRQRAQWNGSPCQKLPGPVPSWPR